MKSLRKFLIIIVICLSVFALAACKENIEVSEITIGKSEISLEEEAMEQINVTVLPENAKDKTVSYVSETPAIATVSNSGLVTGIAIGSTKIIVKAGKIEKNVTVIVTEKDPEILNITAALAVQDKVELTLRGQVTGIMGTQARLADSAAGISLYAIPETLMAKMVVGNVIVVTGKRYYSGVKKYITDITKVIVVETDKQAIVSINLTDLSSAKLNGSTQRPVKGTFEVTQVPTLIEYNENGTLKADLSFKINDGTNEVVFFVKKYLSAPAVTIIKDVIEEIEVGGTITFDKAIVSWSNYIPQIMMIDNSTLSYAAPTEPTSIIIKEEEDFVINTPKQLVASLLPLGQVGTYDWLVNNDEIATISKDGKLTFINYGEVIVTVTVKEYSNLTTTATFILEEIIVDLSNILIDASITEESPSKIIYKDIVYLKGVNAFVSFADAEGVIQDGATINVKPGEYNDASTITASNINIYGPNKGIAPKKDMDLRTEEATIKNTLFIGTKDIKLSNVIIEGLKFTDNSQIYAEYGIDGLEIYNLWFTNSALSSPTELGLVYIDISEVFNETSKNFIAENSYFDDSLGVAQKAIVLNNTRNISINNNYFFQYQDSIRLEGNNNIGAVGTVLISGNEFEMAFSLPIAIIIASATKIDIEYNIINTAHLSTNVGAHIVIRDIVRFETAKIVINIRYNTFGIIKYFDSLRFSSNGCEHKNLYINIEYNKWTFKHFEGRYYVCFEENYSDLVTYATNNYFEFEPVSNDFKSINTYKPYFTDLELFEYKKMIDINPEGLFLLLDKKQIKVTNTAQILASLEGTTFSTSNSSIATIDESGVITGIRIGEVTVFAKNGEKETSVNINIVAEN